MTGQELRTIRKRLNWTQAKLADIVGVSANTVARWERGEVPISNPAARLIAAGADFKRDSRESLVQEELRRPGPLAKKLGLLLRRSGALLRMIQDIYEKSERESLQSKAFETLMKRYDVLVKEHDDVVSQIEASVARRRRKR